MNNEKLTKFLFRARAKTYAGEGGKVDALLSGSTQLEYSEGDFHYRDVYYTGKNTFMGIESVSFKDRPIFGTSYYGNWGEMTEEEIDKILRGALIANPKTRGFKKIKWERDGFVYECAPDSFSQSIDEIGGYESISKDGEEIYHFYYAGSLLNEDV